MAQMTALNFEQAFAITGVATPYNTAANRPLFNVGDDVYYLPDAPAAASSGKQSAPYTVLFVGQFPVTVSGEMKFMDQTRTFATPADGTTSRATPVGFQHTTTPVATVGACVSNAWFYVIRNQLTGETLYNVHSCQLNTPANWATYIAAIASTVYTG